MKVVIPHQISMVSRVAFGDAVGSIPPAPGDVKIWMNDDLSAQEQRNLSLIKNFWDCWKTSPFDVNKIGQFFAPDITVRTGWRGEHVIQGRDNALAIYSMEAKRQAEYREVSDFRFPVVIAKGPVVFHTWIWISKSEQLDYHIERPMVASFLITDGLIERWDSYCTGPESEPGYSGGSGPDGL